LQLGIQDPTLKTNDAAGSRGNAYARRRLELLGARGDGILGVRQDEKADRVSLEEAV
jgi:hypothetical protein